MKAEFEARERHEQEAAHANGHSSDLEVIVSQDAACVEVISPHNLCSMADAGTMFGVVHHSVRPLLNAALARHREPRTAPRVTLIVASREAPANDRRREDPVFSFLASVDLLQRVELAERPVQTWSFELMYAVLAGVRFNVDVQIVHKPDAPQPVPTPLCDFDVIIPHRGIERHLRLCVDSVRRQRVKGRISVALDQEVRCVKFLHDVNADSAVHVFQCFPHPVGPYVARHRLGHAATAEFIAWQDSDDASLPTRLRTLADAANKYGAGLVGSHELEIDETKRQVVALRYPLDVNAALDRIGAGHQLLFPMTIVRREVFAAVGGLSTNRIFSLDVNFWLAATQHTRAINVDEFLYLRRRRPGSLTRRPDLGSHSEVRKALRAKREADYLAIRAGTLRIEDSSLALRHRDEPVEIRPLTSAEEPRSQ
jgi:hypothetical protein